MQQIIYKYKGIRTKEDLVRVVDIVKNHRIYIPKYYELNDPLEGQIINIVTDGYPGCSISLNMDDEDKYVKSEKEEYRILSLAESCDNPQLWAHYANNYDGVCLCFSTLKSFRKLKKVHYSNKREDVYIESDDELKSQIERSLFKKNAGWSYEKEWRIISRDEDMFYRFDKDELVGIIFGHGLSKEIENFLLQSIGKRVMKMRTSVGYRTYRINILPISYKYDDIDGAPLQVLDVEKSLLRGEFFYRSIFDDNIDF